MNYDLKISKENANVGDFLTYQGDNSPAKFTPMFTPISDVGFPYDSERYIIPAVGADASVNHANLLAAIADANTRTPYGNALSPLNRVTILLFPGTYSGGNTPIVLSADYVDLEGVAPDRRAVQLVSSLKTVIQTNENANISNLTIRSTLLGNTLLDDFTDPAAYNMVGGPNSSRITNVEFVGTANNGDYEGAWCMMLANNPFYGEFKDCVATKLRAEDDEPVLGDRCFGGNFSSTLAGTYTNCTAGTQSFGGISANEVSGIFTNCNAGNVSFGGDLATNIGGTFTNCNAGVASFGGNGASSIEGTFTNCKAGAGSFGGESAINVSGNFTDCTADSSSFGGNYTNGLQGSFTRCVAAANSFGGLQSTDIHGKYVDCVAGAESFGGPETTIQGEYINCKASWKSFGKALTNAKIKDCVATNYSQPITHGAEGSFGNRVAGSISGKQEKVTYGFYDLVSSGSVLSLLGLQLPAGSIIYSLRGIIYADIVGDGTGDDGLTKIGVGIPSNPDIFGLSANLLAGTTFGGDFSAAPFVHDGSDIAVYTVDNAGDAVTEKFASGSYRIEIVYSYLPASPIS